MRNLPANAFQKPDSLWEWLVLLFTAMGNVIDDAICNLALVALTALLFWMALPTDQQEHVQRCTVMRALNSTSVPLCREDSKLIQDGPQDLQFSDKNLMMTQKPS